MPGFVRSPYTDANFLKSLFNEDADEFLILKELIQNADDSAATTMTLGCSAGLLDATHPLLSAPALFAVNDGLLRREDALALVSLGRSTKGGDASTVGKFGLGLKSVFFLTEGLFFLDGRISPEIVWDHPHFDILSPWLSGEPPRRPKWKTFTKKDRGRIVTHLETLGIPKGFVVWIPLRRELDCIHPNDRRLEAVIQNFVGDKPFLLSTKLLESVGALLPLLGHLKEIVAFPGTPETKMTFKQVGESRTPNLNNMHPGHRRFQGEIAQSHRAQKSSYRATESLVDHEELNRLRSSILWPKTEVVTAYGEEKLEDDPSIAHGAVIWTRQRGDEPGCLTIQYSVFLPVGDPEVFSLQGSYSYALTLHGYFFLNPSRKSIFDWTEESLNEHVDSEDKLRRRWNGILAREAVLPHVIPELAEMARSMSQADITGLTEALRSSTLFKSHRSALCARLEWVRAWGPEGFRWMGVPPSAQLLPVPDVPGVDQLIHQLHRRSGPYVLVDARASHLIAENRLLSPWPSEVALDFLLHVDYLRVFGNPEQLKVLTDLVQWLGVKRFAKELLEHLRIALVCADQDNVAQNKKGIVALLSALLPRQLLGLPKSLASETVVRWTEADTSLLLLPGDFPVTITPEKLTGNDVRKLARLIAPEDLLPALKFLSSRAPTEETFRQLTDDLRLIPTLFDDGEEDQRFTPSEVRTQAGLAHVFGFKERESGILDLLRDVITESHIHVVAREILSLYQIDAPSFDLGGILSSLYQAPQLGPPTARLALLRALLNRYIKQEGIKPGDRLGFRLLIHGSPKHRENSERPLLTAGRESGVWWELATLLADTSPLGWTVVKEPVDFLSERQMADLNVKTCQATDVEALIAASPETFPAQKISRPQADTLIINLRRPELLASLPIFESVSGEWVALGPGMHLDGGFVLGQHRSVTLLKDPEDDERLRTRLRELAPPLTAANVWQLFRDDPEPWKRWPTLLQAFERSASPLASNIPWWPLTSGGGCAPRDVLAFPESQPSTELRKLRDASGYSVKVEADLLDEFWSPHRTELIKLLQPSEVQAVKVRHLVQAAPTYQIGELRANTDEWIQAFNQAPPDDVPLLGLMAAIPEDAREQVFGGALRPVDAEHLYLMLDLLFSKATTGGDRGGQKAALLIYPELLANVRKQGALPQLSTTLKLLNRAGEWRSPGSLTRHGSDLADAYVLDEDQACALYGSVLHVPAPEPIDILEGAPDGAVDEQLALSVNTLRAHIRAWERTDVPPEQLGAFLALLDGNPELHDAARGYLGTYDPELLRERAFRDVPKGGFTSGYKSFGEMLGDVRLTVRVEQSSMQTVENLLGEPMVAHFKDDAELSSLFTQAYGKRPFSHDGLFYYPLTIKTVDLSRSDLDLPTLLINSVRWLLQYGYGLGAPPPFLTEAFQEVVKSSQTALAATQRRLLKAASQTWGRQLGVPRESNIRILLGRIDQADRAAEQAREEGASERQREAEGQVAALQGELKHLIEHDVSAQQALLSGMRHKISEQQYVSQSVPFELFQNADDALREWQEMTGEHNDARAGFSLELDGATLRAVYHGRPVNFYAYGDFDGRPRGFDADLEKMLMLMSSDKADNVTGHFGLGFKSVYLLSDYPTVVSGRLNFSVRGGVYPVLPDHERVQMMQACLAERSPADVRDGTLIELPLRDSEAGQLALERFFRLAPVTLSLARALKRFSLTRDDQTHTYVKHETHVTQSVSVVVCQGTTSSWRALKVFGSGVSVIIPLGENGPSGMNPGEPNIWVTAPTREVLGLPFLVDAPFPLDPGRAQLANNHEVLDRLVERWTPGLTQAFRNLEGWTRSWSAARAKLGLNASVSRETFYRDLWRTLATPLAQAGTAPALVTLRRLLWGGAGALSLLARSQPVTPTGIPGEDATLIKVGDPALRTLDFHAKLVPHLKANALFGSKFKPGELIARDMVDTLRNLGLPPPTKKLTLLNALQVALEDHKVTPAIASWLSRFITHIDLASWREDDEVRTWLHSLCFLAQDGEYRISSELLTEAAEDGSDEKQRVAFAPPSARLSHVYPEDSLALFRLLRRTAPTSATGTWLLSAPPELRMAALSYLSRKSPYDPLAEEVRQKSAGTWLDDYTLVASGAYEQLTTHTKIDVLHVLRRQTDPPVFNPPEPPSWTSDEEDEEGEADEFDRFSAASFSPAEALERLYRWWQVEGQAFTKRYEKRTYPGGQPFQIDNDFDVSTHKSRRSWTSLLILGSLQSIGRVQPGQHAAFLRLCEERGWLDTFSGEASDIEWLGVVREYLLSDSETLAYYHWMQRFVGFYQLSHWLRAYVEMFDQADRHARGPVSLAGLFAPSADPRQQGGGVDAPPLTRTLGIGGPFVIRELLRTHVLTNNWLHPLAYVPTRRVRRLVAYLSGETFLEDEGVGAWSRTIHAVLVEHLGAERATFGKHFDLPLLALAGYDRRDESAKALQRDILGFELPVRDYEV